VSFAITPAYGAAPRASLPGTGLQIMADGVAVGDSQVAVIDFTSDPGAFIVTRGVGENSHVITVRKDLAPGCYLETYPNGLDDFTLTLGADKNDLSIVSSPYGPAINGAASFDLTQISKDIGVTIPLVKFSCYLWTGTTHTDDAMAIVLRNLADTVDAFAIIPKRENSYDAARRMLLASGASSVFLSPALADNTWYRVDATFVGTLITVTVTVAATGAAHGSAALTQISGGYQVRFEKYQIDASAGKQAIQTQYARVLICDSL
jgi:hypothetical protein